MRVYNNYLGFWRETWPLKSPPELPQFQVKSSIYNYIDYIVTYRYSSFFLFSTNNWNEIK